MSSALNGLLIGLLLALVVLMGGWVGLLLALVFGGVGFVVAGHLSGEIDLKALRGSRG